MTAEPLIKVSAEEEAYRAKHFNTIRVVKNRQLVCGSCGNQISKESGQVFSHPVIGILQCKTCLQQFKGIHCESDGNNILLRKHCCICGQSRNIYSCKNRSCAFLFCRACIKRNVNLSLLNVEAQDWKCFACVSKPFWELRAVCASVMASLVKRNKRAGLHEIKPYKKHELEKTLLLQKNLKTFCDTEDSSNSLEERSLFSSKSTDKIDSRSQNKNARRSRVLEKNKKQAGTHQVYTSDSSVISESCNLSNDEVQTHVIRHSKSKSRQLTKNIASSSEDEALEFSEDKNLQRKGRMSRTAKEESHDPHLNTSKRKTSKQSETDLDRKSDSKRKIFMHTQLSDSENDQDNSNFVSKLSNEETGRNQKKSNKEEKKACSNVDFGSSSEDDQVNNLRYRKRSSHSYRKRRHSVGNTVAEYHRPLNKCCDDSDCRTHSDSTSGPEFQKLKLSKQLHGSLTKLRNVKNNAKSSKKLSSYFKSCTSNILDKFKGSCSKYDLHMDLLKKKYLKDELISLEHADNFLLKSRVIINKLKLELDKQQKELMLFHRAWEKECDHNSNINLNEVKRKKSPVSENAEQVGEDNCDENSSKSQARRSSSVNLVSDCDSEEIFSGSESKTKERDKTANLTTTDVNEDRSFADIIREDISGSDKQLASSQSPILGSSKEKKSTIQRDNISSTKRPLTDQTTTEKASCSSKSMIETMPDNNEKSDSKQTPNVKDKENEIEITHMENPDTSKISVTNSAVNKDNNEAHDSMEDMFDTTLNFESDVRTSVSNSQIMDISQDQDNTNDLISNCNKDSSTYRKEMEKNELNDEENHIVTKENSSKEMQTVRIENKKQADDIQDDSPVLEELSQISEKECISERKKKACSSPLAESDIGTNSRQSDSSLPETPKNKKSATQDSINLDNMSIHSSCETFILADTNDKNTSQVAKNRSKAAKKKKERINSEDTSSSDEQDSGKVEETAKQVLLEDSDDSTFLSCETVNTKNTKKIESDDNSDNFNAKNALLRSSNSESSGSDCDLDRDTNSFEMDINNSTLSKRTWEPESDTSVGMRVKKRRLNLNKNRYYMSDKKLQMECKVILERLPQKVLKRYARALRKSRLHLEHKSIKSLINLEKLERPNKKGSGNNTLKESSRKHKKKMETVNEENESLMDHLKRVENGEVLEDVDKDANHEELNEDSRSDAIAVTNQDLLSEADAVAKNILLNSSGSEAEQEETSDKSDDESTNTKKDKVAFSKEKSQSSKKSTTEDTEKDAAKSKWRRNKILTTKFSDTDSEAEKRKFDIKQEKLQAKMEEDEGNDSQKEVVAKKPRKKSGRRIIDSDSDILLTDVDSDSVKSAVTSDEKQSSNSDVDNRKRRKRLRKSNKSTESDSSTAEKKSKPKRKRIKKMPSDSDSDKDSDRVTSSQGTPGKSGRKNIRKVLKDKQVTEDTKQAAKEEEERIKRIADRQKLYNEMYEIRLAGEKKVDKLVLDFDTETKEELVSVHKDLVKRLKPHQAQGIKFMWDACFESLERIKTTPGSGCIIAHCMGLGKTLQVISLIHTLLIHESTGVKTIMVVSPLSTVLNWVNEFNMWLEGIDTIEVEVYELTKFKKNFERKYQLQQWQKTGGVLIIGYEMFRNLSGANKNMRKNMKEAILECLIDPGPDLIVCDEGHLLKNEDTALSKCMKRVKTLRRIVLTGTPLQNNLIEYHCMVQFVKPNLLGTKKEFLNRFVNPITNGQFDDSTAHDVKVMKKRAHVLHKMLEGCVQRFDYSVLMPFLPPKQEYVIFVRLTEVQIKMYQHYLDNFARRHGGAGGSLFADFQALQRIWTHPIVLRLNAEKVEKANERKRSSSESEGSLKDFINDDSDSESETTKSSSDDDIQTVHDSRDKAKPQRRTRNTPLAKEETPEPVVNTEDKEWWSEFVQPEHFEDMKISAKLVLLFGILKESEQIGDKVLVFSQSLYSLTLIEQFLSRIDDETQAGTSSEYINGHSGSWSLGLDYFRLDGQTSAENRNAWCKIFNRPKNTRARLFLISTRAGGLGINLTSANRVIIFDASWNPSHDVQSIFRIYRFGQKKPCYVYRFLASGTMEEKIYNRQVTKLSLSCRVVDEQQIERHYSNNDLNELYKFEPNTEGERPTLNLPKDRLLAEIFLMYKDFVENYHEHDSLLENKAEEELDEEERKQAWLEYEEEKKGKPPQMYPMMTQYQNTMLLNQYNMLDQTGLATQNPSMQIDYENLQQLIRKDYPNATLEQQKMMTTTALLEMYNYWEQQAILQPARNAMMSQRRAAGLLPGVNVNPVGYNTQSQQIQVRPQIQVDQHVKHKQQVFNQPTTSTSMRDTNLNSHIYNNTTMNTPGGTDDDIVEVTANSVSVIPVTTQSTSQQGNSNKAQEE